MPTTDLYNKQQYLHFDHPFRISKDIDTTRALLKMSVDLVVVAAALIIRLLSVRVTSVWWPVSNILILCIKLRTIIYLHQHSAGKRLR